MKTKVKIKTFSSIVIEGIKTLFFSEIKKKKKTNKHTNPTFNKSEKEFSTLNNQLSTKKLQRFIINWVINETLKNFPYPYGRFIIVIN